MAQAGLETFKLSELRLDEDNYRLGHQDGQREAILAMINEQKGNRTNRSGIINGGIIGGYDQGGEWKIDARFNRTDLMQRIEKIASYSPRITLYNMDAAKFITDKLPTIPKKSLVYLDPPYYEKGSELYESHYKPDDHATIAALVANIKQKWLVSYDNVRAIRKLYPKFEKESFGLRYSAQDRYDGREVMIFCRGLKTPASVESWRGLAA